MVLTSVYGPRMHVLCVQVDSREKLVAATEVMASSTLLGLDVEWRPSHIHSSSGSIKSKSSGNNSSAAAAAAVAPDSLASGSPPQQQQRPPATSLLAQQLSAAFPAMQQQQQQATASAASSADTDLGAPEPALMSDGAEPAAAAGGSAWRGDGEGEGGGRGGGSGGRGGGERGERGGGGGVGGSGPPASLLQVSNGEWVFVFDLLTLSAEPLLDSCLRAGFHNKQALKVREVKECVREREREREEGELRGEG
jgi:hypothetical protein